MDVKLLQDGICRQIKGGFGICGSREDLRSLACQILNVIDESNFNHGWINIHPEHSRGIGNPPALPWKWSPKEEKEAASDTGI